MATTAWFNTGSSIGNMLAPPLVTFCILSFGWQSAFVVTGGLSLLWAALWYAVYRRPEEHARISAGERAMILGARDGAADGAAGNTAVSARPTWREIAATRSFWSIAIRGSSRSRRGRRSTSSFLCTSWPHGSSI